MVFSVGTPNSDFLTGTAGNDTILALAGNDTVLGQDSNDQLFGFENNDILYGNRGNDTLRGGQDNDQLYGGQDNDQLYGDKGNDTVFGDKGSDTIYGLDDNDLVFADQENDFVFGNKGNDTIRGGKDNDLLRGGKDNDALYGDLGNDSLYGDQDNDTLFGSEGNDLLSGNQGNDALNSNMGSDTVYGGQGNDTVRGGMQNDSLFGDKGNDTLYGDLGDDTIYGGADTDLIFGDQAGEDKFGGTGKDVLFGNEGNDTIFGLGGGDIIYGNQGDDLILGNMAQETLYGGQDDDTVRGGMQSDRLFGDKGSDVLYGDLGADTLTGDVAGDTISDTFVIGRVSGITGTTAKTTGGPKREDADVITDFQACTDLISLTGGLAYDNLNIFQGTDADAANTIIQDKGTGEFLVVLQGFNRNNIDGTSFIPAGPPDVRILATDGFATEPAIGDTIDTGEFTISLPCPVETALPISYTISGTATNGQDYNPLSGIAIIPTGSNTITIPIIPLGDTLAGEGNETVTLTLDDLEGYNPQTPLTATVNITDGPVVLPNQEPTVIVSAIDPEAGEPDRKEGTGAFQFARTGGDTSKDVTISFTVTGTATPGKDYTALPATVTILAGKTVSEPIIVTPSSDNRFEPTETVVVTIAQDTDYMVGAADTATVRILEKNPPLLPRSLVRYDASGTKQGVHNNFTEAVAAASDGDYLVASADTYNEPGTVVINKQLTIFGPNAGLSPGSGVPPAIVTAPANQPVFTIQAGVNNVYIQGLTIQLNGDNGIRLQGASDNLLISQNEFTGKGPANGGAIYLDTGGAASSVEVTDNYIHDVTTVGDTTSGIQLFRFSTIRVTDNQIARITGPGIVADAITNAGSIISNNTIDSIGEQGIQLASGSATIINNDITNANLGSDGVPNSGDEDVARGGIRLRISPLNTSPLETVNVLSNTITNSLNGVVITNETAIPSTVRINSNNLIGNTKAGLFHNGTGALNAEDNWWDNPAGPVVGGTGPNAIAGASAGLVDFDPFSPTPL